MFYVICILMLVALVVTAAVSTSGKAAKEAAKTETGAETGGAEDTPGKNKPDNGAVFNEQDGEGTRAVTGTEKPAEEKTPDEPGTDTSASTLPDRFEMPIKGMVLKKFYGNVPVYSETLNNYRTHMGVDLQGQPGTPVQAFADGTVEAIYTDEFMGGVMVISHTGGMKSYYMNIGDVLPQGIEEGSEVTCGQTVAGVGSGSKLEALDGSHLHFEVSLKGERVDPLQFIDHATLADYEYEGYEE